MNWLTYALFGMVCFATMILIFKKLTSYLKPNILLLFIFCFGMIFYLIDSLYTKSAFNLNSKIILLLIIAAFFSYLGNLLYVKSISIAPNPGYSVAIVSLQAIIITLGSYFLYGSEISGKSLIGIIFGVIAIILLSFK